MIARSNETAVRTGGVEETRARILEATRELYECGGSRGTTTRAVADLAGVNEATVFRHFGTKQQLISAMLECFTSSTAFGETIAQIEEDATLETQLRALTVAAIDSLRRKENLIKVAMAEEVVNPTGHSCAWRAPTEARRALRAYFGRRVAAGTLRGEPSTLARIFLALSFSYVMGRALWEELGEMTQEDVVERMVDIFLNGARAI